MSKRFDGVNILVGITGGIAAYKACDVIRELQRQGAANVTAMMTPSAQQFITPLTLESLTRHKVYTDAFENDETGTPTHIALAQAFDLLLILPATAHTMAKLAHGEADNILTTTALTFTQKPIVVAPAMNTRMWENPATQRNLEIIESFGHIDVIPPDCGLLACGETGAGKLAQMDLILSYVARAAHPLRGLLNGQKIVVTAGGTQEPIDPVRFMTNRSSGKMGGCLADEAWAMGAEVTLIHAAPKDLIRPYTIEAAPTVSEMAVKTHDAFKTATGLLMAAAVSDFTTSDAKPQKIKKADTLTLELSKAQDILLTMGQAKQPGQWTVGFAAETHEMAQYAQDKLQSKHCDMLVANDVSRNDIGMNADENEVVLYTPDQAPTRLEKQPKGVIARQILTHLSQHVLHQAVPAMPVAETAIATTLK